MVTTASLQAPTTVLTIPVTLALQHCADVVPLTSRCSSALCPGKLLAGSGTSMGPPCSLHWQTTKRLRRAAALEQGRAPLGRAWLLSLACLHERLSEHAASLVDSVSSPWSFASAGLVVSVGDLPSPLFPCPFEDLGHGSLSERAAAGFLGCLGSPWPCVFPRDAAAGPRAQYPGMSRVPKSAWLSGMQGFWVEKAEYQSLVQPGAGEVCAPCRLRVLWSDDMIPKGLWGNQGAARVLELPRAIAQWAGCGTFWDQCMAQLNAPLWLWFVLRGLLVWALQRDRLNQFKPRVVS